MCHPGDESNCFSKSRLLILITLYVDLSKSFIRQGPDVNVLKLLGVNLLILFVSFMFQSREENFFIVIKCSNLQRERERERERERQLFKKCLRY